MSPGFEANDLGYHTRGDLINGHVEAGYQIFHPGPAFRSWTVTGSYYRNYDFGGNRIGEYIYLDGKAQFLNYWTATLHLDYEPPKYSHYLTRGGPMAFYPSGATVRATLASDDRKPLIVRFSGYYRYHPSGGYNWSLGGGVTWKPSPNFSLSVGPSYTWRYSEGQWVRSVVDPLKTSTYGVRYVLSDIVQKTLPVEIRVNWTFTPRLSLQAYLQPYIGTGDYRAFKELHAARTFDFDFYGDGDSTIAFADGVYTVDPDGAAGPAGAVHLPRSRLQPQVAARDGRPALGVPAGVDALFRLDAEAGRLRPSRRLRALARPGRPLPGPGREHLHDQVLLPLRALSSEADVGGAPAAAAHPGVPETRHARILLEQAVDDRLERPRALAVDDAELGDPPAQAFLDVLGDEVLDVFRAEGVEVEDAVDGDLDRIVAHRRLWVDSSASAGRGQSPAF